MITDWFTLLRLPDLPPPPPLLLLLDVEARVVEVKVSETPPMVRVVWTEVLLEADEVWRTRMTSPALTVPEAVVEVAPLMEYCPPVTEMVVVPLIPATTIAFDSIVVFK